jgi:pyrophosphatase PpaX
VPAPRPLLFDLDGTLVDTVPFILTCARHAFEGYGRPVTDAEWINGIGTPLRTQLASLALHPDDVEPLLARYRTFWLENHDRLTHPFPGAVELVHSLAERGHPLAVVTSKTIAGAKRTLEHVGLPELVETLIAADSCPRSKPDPMPVHLALERLGCAASTAHSLMIGDSPHDVAAGKAAGTIAVAALWGACTRDALATASPDHFLAELGELPVLLRALDATE